MDIEEITLKNYGEVLQELHDLLMKLDLSNLQNQVDIYLYVDEGGNGTLDTFDNVGGNSWIDDDHITLARIEPLDFGDELWNDWEMDDILAEIGKTKNEIFEEMKAAGKICEYSDIEEITHCDYRHYIRENREYNDRLNEATVHGKECNGDYWENAKSMLEGFEE